MATPKKTKDAAVVTAPVAGTPAPAATDAMAAVRAARNTATENDVFGYVKDMDKGAPQMKTIVNVLKAAGKPLKRSELTAALVGILVTRQTPARILAYYQKELVSSGCVTLSKAEVPAAAPVQAAA